mmetsp:Transcript_75498/g.218017  ORF Transcript_75498/g.218017 Transcript_75498/m.218017 type:complete len:203 (-) Transcript_75498:206-814(-)
MATCTRGAFARTSGGSVARWRTHSRAHKLCTSMSKWLSAAFRRMASAPAGFRSFATTRQPWRAQSSANAPTPANKSMTMSAGLTFASKRTRSSLKREFQYTFRKSNFNFKPISDTVTSVSSRPAMTSMSNVLNSFDRDPTFVTTVLMHGFLSKTTWPIARRYGHCASRKLKCAKCPTVSKPRGTSTPAGRIRCSASSAVTSW